MNTNPMLKKSQVDYKNIITKISKQIEAVGKERDKIDDLIGELEHLRDNCLSAYDALWNARDALSELV
jgi:hypothetical protein